MLYVFRGNHLEALASLLATMLEQDGALPEDPFAPARVVVGSSGMERWLRHRLACSLKSRVVANMEFPYPTQAMEQALKALGQASGADVASTEENPWSPGVLTWAIMRALPELLEREPEAMAPIRSYLGGSTITEVTPRTWALVTVLADVCDRLIMYRPSLAMSWFGGDRAFPAPLQKLQAPLGWQPLLWSAVADILGADTHQAARWDRAMSQGAPQLDRHDTILDQPLRLFGISSLPPVFLQRLEWLSRHHEVQLYVLCPSDLYWADLHGLGARRHQALMAEDRDKVPELLWKDIQRIHPLLLSMGRVGRDLQVVLEAMGGSSVDRAERDIFLDPADTPTPSALEHLQSDILHLRDPAGFTAETRKERALDPGDQSVQLHACYGPMRQVEVLREALIHLFDRFPHLEPRDVMVMSPDMETFVPLISAVFSQGEDKPRRDDPSGPPWGTSGAPRLPYVIADRSIRSTNPVAEVLLRVLDLASPGVRLTATSVMDLLDLDPFRRRFGIESEDLDTIRGWVQDVGIRWGLDASDRATHGQPPDPQNTWRAGLERLALGVTMADEPDRIFDHPPDADTAPPHRRIGVLPHDPMEGGALSLVGRFLDACGALFGEVARLRETRTLPEWLQSLAGLGVDQESALTRLTATTAKARWLAVQVRAELQTLLREAEVAGSPLPLQPVAVRDILAGRFDNPSGATYTHTGAVTFSAMVPFRSVPYKVVCLLGMDDGVFPRVGASRRFDLTQLQPRVGDRDPRDEDRHLLLEAILAAREHLLILYTGFDPRSNEEVPPAVPVGELQDVLDATFVAPPEPHSETPPSKLLTRRHPLQPFSPRCFTPGAIDRGAGPWSFDSRLAAGARAILGEKPELPPFLDAPPTAPVHTPTTATIEEWTSFFKDPVLFFTGRRLNLDLYDDAESLPDREPLEANNLDHWLWRRDLLDASSASLGARDNAPVSVTRARIRSGGTLPLGIAGDRELQTAADLVSEIMERAEPWTSSATPREVNVDIPVAGGRLLGAAGPILGADLLCLVPGDPSQGKYLVGPWIRYLAWLAEEDGPIRSTILIGTHKGKVKAARLRLEPDDTASQGPRAAAILDELARIRARGMERPIPLFKDTSFAFARKLSTKAPDLEPADLEDLDGEDEPSRAVREALGSARTAWDDGYNHVGEGSSPHCSLIFGGDRPTDDDAEPRWGLDLEFGRLAMSLWGPCLASFEEEKKHPFEPSGADGDVS